VSTREIVAADMSSSLAAARRLRPSASRLAFTRLARVAASTDKADVVGMLVMPANHMRVRCRTAAALRCWWHVVRSTYDAPLHHMSTCGQGWPWIVSLADIIRKEQSR